jgi:hypothetical protein
VTKLSKSAKAQGRFKTPEREAFAALLIKALDRASSSTYDFGVDLGTPSLIHRVKTAVRPIPVALLHKWTARLGLKGSELEEFLVLALVAKMAGAVRKTFQELGWEEKTRDYALPPAFRRRIFKAALRKLAEPKVWEAGARAVEAAPAVRKRKPEVSGSQSVRDARVVKKKPGAKNLRPALAG